jgi:uncharacterized protein YqgV (UPF0045/DUF77 family)
MNWIANNIGAVVTIVVVVLGVAATWVMYGARITQLEKDIKKLIEVVEKLEEFVRTHHADTSLHIDPHRDEKRWDDFKDQIFQRIDGIGQRFDSTDRKIERLMMVIPPTPPGSL